MHRYPILVSWQHLSLFLVLTLLSFPLAQATSLNEGYWLNDDYENLQIVIDDGDLNWDMREQPLKLTGGHFWHIMNANIQEGDQWVIDFESTTIIGQFTHYVLDSENNVVLTLHGGNQSSTLNPYFLRHGRDLSLPPGQYRIVTELTSELLLAQPKPRLYPRLEYIKSIKQGNTLTMLGLGVFLALGVYYFVLGLTRKLPTDFLYAVFILCNLIWNSTALNVVSDVFQVSIYSSIGLPIMLSNMAYVAFVRLLLGITADHYPKLYKTGQISLYLLGSFWLIVPFAPNLSLEFARYGVAIFASYGLTCGIYMVRQGNKTARYYLVANIAFLIPAMFAVILQSVPYSTIFVEHIGLMAVALEVILLSLVLSYQLSIIYKEKSASLLAAQNAIEVADNAVKTKERFLANISHELRTPLNAIQGSIDLIEGQTHDKQTQESINTIKHSSTFLLFLINDILDLAKLNENMFVIDRREFNIRETVAKIAKIYDSSYPRPLETQFRVDIAEEVPELIVGDENRIEQVLANLLSNAFKFTEQGQVTLDVALTDQQLKFTVTDTGIGIDPANLDSMFSAFTQADSSISRRYGGTGLGLRIASRIVELMGGQINADSQPGQGSTFWFTLPFDVQQQHETKPRANALSQEVSFEGLKAIVVDDNEVNLKVIEAMLRKLNIQSHCFTAAEAAIEFALSHDSQLMILDIQMPGMDGLTAAKNLRRQGYMPPIIAFTANSSEEDQSACFDAGMNDILIKPIQLQTLIKMLGKWYPPVNGEIL